MSRPLTGFPEKAWCKATKWKKSQTYAVVTV